MYRLENLEFISRIKAEEFKQYVLRIYKTSWVNLSIAILYEAFKDFNRVSG